MVRSIPASILLLLVVLAAILLASAPVGDPPPRRHAANTPQQGLPLENAVWAPYHADPAHPLNEIFRTVFLNRVAPATVGAALPGAHGDGFWRARWMLEWRDGVEQDEALFGGDGRQLPREGFDDAESQKLVELLAGLDDGARRALVETPELAVLFQHDLLRLAQRLMDTERNPELLEPLWRAIQWAALDRDQLASVRDVLPAALDTKLGQELAGRNAVLAAIPQLSDPESTPFRELLRRSTRLFDGARTMLWSRLFLSHPDGVEALHELVADAARGDAVVPIGVRAVLLQGIVALDRDGVARATPVIVDARAQVLANRDPVSLENPTTSRDGVDFAMLQLEREGLRRGDAVRFYRRVDDQDQDLFRDYGTLKHTTYRAQCSLCHRTTGTPEPELGGFSVLRKGALPRFATSGDERLRLAEEQVMTTVQALRTAVR